MKHVVTLLVVLGLAASANAALFTEDFSGTLAAWSGQDSGQIIVGNQLQDLDDTQESVMSATFAGQTTGVLTLNFDMSASGAWAPASAALVDSAGTGAFLDLYIGDTYLGFGSGETVDGGASAIGLAYGDNSIADTSVMTTLTYELNLDTGALVGKIGSIVYHSDVIDLSGVNAGGINTIAFKTKKKVSGIDNIVVDIPEPASMVLLGMGGLGMLIRRKR